MQQGRVLIIAEAGVNHNGSIDMAKDLIDAAANAGADYVKFQSFRAEKVVSREARTAEYQKQNIGEEADSQFEMLKKLELTIEDHHELIKHAQERGIRFISTAFDLESIDLLESLNIDLFKIPSGEITNLPYLEKIGRLNKKTIVSTGMCVLEEIHSAVNALVASGTDRSKISVLHCTSDYPTSYSDVNLLAINTLAESLKLPIGYSDHTLGIEVPIAAVAMGATIIEKHFTLDCSLPGPDHKASLEPDELKKMVRSIRNIELALGNADKKPTNTELKNMLVARKSIHTSSALSAGHIVSLLDLEMKRPGDGINPMEMKSILGRKIKKELPAEHKLRWEDLV